LSFRGAPPGASPESILSIVVMDSGLAALRRPGMTTEIGGTPPHSRGSEAPGSCIIRCPSKEEGAGNAGCWPHPQPRVKQKTREFVTTGQPTHAGIPCAMVLRLIAGSPRRPGFDCLRRLRVLTLRLDPSIGGSGPHAFAVREGCFRPRVAALKHPHVHRIPLPTSVTIAIRPSCGGGMRRDDHMFLKNGRGIFFAEGVDKISD